MASSPSPTRPSLAEAAALTRRITLLSATTALLLLALKAVVWGLSGSVAVLASLADSGLDLLASLATFFAVRYAASPADAEHRFGHGKAEAFTSLIQAALVLVSAALIGREAIERLVDPRPLAREGWAMGVMAASLLITGVLVAAQTRVLARTGSVAVEADRAHYAADVASNLVALLGIAAAVLLDRPVLDAAAGLVVGLWLVWGAFKVFRAASRHLMDRELPDTEREALVQALFADPAVEGVHQLRTRASGPYVHVQAHIDVEPTMTLLRAHDVIEAAESRLLALFPGADVILHVDPRGEAEHHPEEYSEERLAHRADARYPDRPKLKS
ncbi:MAG: cation diffusion facilitator family transporter [Proteobacteria bacterium]|nr:cation diffusion facilitator family transporter [Pseudomonadota bacterium]